MHPALDLDAALHAHFGHDRFWISSIDIYGHAKRDRRLRALPTKLGDARRECRIGRKARDPRPRHAMCGGFREAKPTT